MTAWFPDQDPTSGHLEHPDRIYEECPSCGGLCEMLVGLHGNHPVLEPCTLCSGRGYIEHSCDSR